MEGWRVRRERSAIKREKMTKEAVNWTNNAAADTIGGKVMDNAMEAIGIVFPQITMFAKRTFKARGSPTIAILPNQVSHSIKMLILDVINHRKNHVSWIRVADGNRDLKICRRPVPLLEDMVDEDESDDEKDEERRELHIFAALNYSLQALSHFVSVPGRRKKNEEALGPKNHQS